MGGAEAVDLTVRAARAYGRPDLAERVELARQRAAERQLHAVVVGEFKQGKSSLVNALLGRRVCPVDDDLATAAPTMLRWGPQPQATVHLRDGGEPREIAVGDVATWASEHGNAGNERGVQAVDVALPAPLLQDGLVLVDTPGIGGLGSRHSVTTFAALPMADAALFVTAADQELTAAEVDHLRTTVRLCPTVLLVLTKIDLYPAWRAVAAGNRRILDAERLAVPIVALSSFVREHALATRDAAANDESGVPALGRWLFETLPATHGGNGGVARHAAAVVDTLLAGFRSEQEALSSPAPAGAVEAARAAAQRATAAAGRWAVALNDELAEVQSDADHDLRARLRDVVRRADEQIDATDPAHSWRELEPWLYREVAAEVATSYALVQERLQKAAATVAAVLDAEEVSVVELLRFAGEAAIPDSVAADLDVRTSNLAARGLTALRSSYGGMLMFGMLGSLAGLTVATPVVLALGALMGRKGVHEEEQRQLAQRRAQAKAAVRRYVDDVTFAVGKDSRDTLRRAHRVLRDHFAARAEETRTSAARAVAAAESAAAAGDAERARRLADVEAEIARLAALRSQLAEVGA